VSGPTLVSDPCLLQLPNHGLAIRAAKGKHGSLARLDATLRALPRPVISRQADKAMWLDLRRLEPVDEPAFTTQLAALRP
jgi:L-seryl-tRNA(Ser) seleniumtransferase